MFFCDPPGKSDPDSLINYGSDQCELNYIFFHDQEPIHLDLHEPLFNNVVRRNQDLNWNKGANIKAIITSEYDSNDVKFLEKHYGWKHFYYFFHGWASLDWYRGYDKTFLHLPKNINHTFLFPNNIIGGYRRHRLELFCELEKRNLIEKNLISFPEVCPYENMSVNKLCDLYGLSINTTLPLRLDNYDCYAQNSHKIDMWQQSAQSLVYIVGETVFYGEKKHLTEKTFKPIVLKQPFIIASCKGSLQYLKKYGFETFSSIWDESYDEANDDTRCKIIADLLLSLENENWKNLYKKCLPIIEHNYNHFYGGGFENILWREFTSMLEQIENHW